MWSLSYEITFPNRIAGIIGLWFLLLSAFSSYGASVFIKLQETFKATLTEMEPLEKLTLLGSITILASTMISLNNGLITTTPLGPATWAIFSQVAFIIALLVSIFLILIDFKKASIDLLTVATIIILMSIASGFILYLIAIVSTPSIFQIFFYLWLLQYLPLAIFTFV